VSQSALSFWKEVYRQYLCKWRTPNLIVDPKAGYVNSRIVECEDSRIPKCNSLLNLDFLACETLCD
jgi:hypothetical protein